MVPSAAHAAVAVTVGSPAAGPTARVTQLSGSGQPGEVVRATIDGDATIDAADATVDPGGDWSVSQTVGGQPLDLEDGQYVVTAAAFDGAVQTSTATQAFVVDRVAPEVFTVATPAESGVVYDPTPRLGGTLSDARTGPGEVEVTFSGPGPAIGPMLVEVAAGAWATDAPALQPGVWTLGFTGIDGVTNRTSTVVRILTIGSDTTAPTVAVDRPVDGTAYPAGGVTLSGTASDPDGHLQDVVLSFSVNGGAPTTFVAPVAGDGTWTASPPLADDAWTLSAQARDVAGNLTEEPVIRSFFVGAAAPPSAPPPPPDDGPGGLSGGPGFVVDFTTPAGGPPSPGGGGTPLAGDRSATSACAKRAFTMRVPGRVLGATLTRASGAVVRPLPVKGASVRVAVRGLAKGRYRVRVTSRRGKGKRMLTVRSFTVC